MADFYRIWEAISGKLQVILQFPKVFHWACGMLPSEGFCFIGLGYGIVLSSCTLLLNNLHDEYSQAKRMWFEARYGND